jgi:A/G-specific adenine glycosylase
MNFTLEILHWYSENKRPLPWRKTCDPYCIWVSEIIHQQTRVGQGTGYYHRFMETFPTIHHLASAPEEAILNVWQGLGYYSRARNMHSAAKEIVSIYNGKFPDNYEQLKTLKGVGPYTAAAISSIAFNEPCPVVDGNVLRFFSRLFGVLTPVDQQAGKKEIYDLALKFIEGASPGEYNQAIMEFGSLQCKPGVPDCSICPFQKVCYANLHGVAKDLPAKSKVTRQRTRYLNYLVISQRDSAGEGSLYLRKRESKDIWKGLYDFPAIETDCVVTASTLKNDVEWKALFGVQEPVIQKKSQVYKHVLSHQVIQARFYFVKDVWIESPGVIQVPFHELKRYPIPRLIERFLQDEKLI